MTARAAIALFLASFGFFGLTAHGYIENTDAEITMHAARAWWLRGDPGLRSDAPDATAAERFIAAAIDGGRYGMRGVDGSAYVWFPIGHQLAMVPCVAVGELFAEWCPEAERAYSARKRRGFGEHLWTRFFVSFLPVVAAAGTAVVLFWLALELGCGVRAAAIATGAATLTTQLWPASNETLSDGPGGFLLIAMAALVVRYHRGAGGGPGLLAAGLCGGWAVLMRYPHAFPVTVFALVAAWSALRRRHRSGVGWLLLGGAPELALLVAANYLRFGDVLETGYSPGANADWFGFAPQLGIPSVLLAPGKGILWFSPALWLALPVLFSRAVLRVPLLPVALVLVGTVVGYGHTAGWAAGQCWGIRYLTPAVVLTVAVALAIARPWRRWPRRFTAVCVLGFAVSLGGVLAPYRGQQELAYEAARVEFRDAPQLDNNVNWAPSLSPIHTHWIYACLSASGRLERGGEENTTVPLFGVDGVGDVRVEHWEDRGFRHLWMPFLAALLGMSVWSMLLPWLALTAVAWWWVGRELRSTPPPTAAARASSGPD